MPVQERSGWCDEGMRSSSIKDAFILRPLCESVVKIDDVEVNLAKQLC